ncbi:MAG: phosphoglucosamine mutase, partial [Bacteroidota bacterium]
MALITSISGIRGTIGGAVGGGLTPIDTVKFVSAFGSYLKQQHEKVTVVIGRDARISGEMVAKLVSATLQGLGIDVLDIDLATTPTVELAVVDEKAQGGIIITASHNPGQWNALKLLNESGEFISAEAGKAVLDLAEAADFDFATVNKLGAYQQIEGATEKH